MNESVERIIRICRKLLDRTIERGCTPDEAAGAAEKAKELLERHQLTLLDVKAGKLNEDMTNQVMPTGKKRSNPGESSLAFAVAKGCDCDLVNGYDRVDGRVYHFLGYQSDVEVAQHLFVYLRDGLVNMANAEGRRQNFRGAALVCWRNNFLFGAAGVIRKRLKERKADEPTAWATAETVITENEPVAETDLMPSPAPVTESQRYALVSVKQPAVQAFVKSIFPKLLFKSNRVRHNYSAVEAGRRAGQRIAIRRGLEKEIVAALPT